MITIETASFVQGSYKATAKKARWDVDDFNGKVGVWMSNVEVGDEATICFESGIASGTCAEAMVVGEVVYYDPDSKMLYKTATGDGAGAGAIPVGYATSSTEAVGDKLYFRFTQKYLS